MQQSIRPSRGEPRGGRARTTVALALLLLSVSTATAEIVHVVEQTIAGGETNLLTDATLEAGTSYRTSIAPELPGFLFTHWSTDALQPLVTRDAWGRAHDAAPFHLYEAMTLTAHYQPDGLDTDLDKIEDGHELYWYGDLDRNGEADTDGDGAGFARELARGTSPHFPDDHGTEVTWATSGPILYNPNRYAPYLCRSEPEGLLFPTSTNYAKAGEVVYTPAYSPLTSTFSYWTVNGKVARDSHGTALGSVPVVCSQEKVTECIAWCVEDETLRASLHYYGKETAPESDSDSDGVTFGEEVARGTSPLFSDRYFMRVTTDSSPIVFYNPNNFVPTNTPVVPTNTPPRAGYILRSEPEGVLFATVTNYTEPGAVTLTPTFYPQTSAFAFWTINGKRQDDTFGIALDQVSFVGRKDAMTECVAHAIEDELDRHSTYYYGKPFPAGSDTDGDGMTLAEEIVLGTCPLFPDSFTKRIARGASPLCEANLQPFEQLQTALVDGKATPFFESTWAANDSLLFGKDLSPAVADLDRDGLFDLVLASSSGEVEVYLNKGRRGSPDFHLAPAGYPSLSAALATNKSPVLAGAPGGVYLGGDPIRFFPYGSDRFAKKPLSGLPAWWKGELYALRPDGTVATTNGPLALDLPVLHGLSITIADADLDGLDDLLASDDEGRIWYYRATPSGRFVLRHKVWGGTYKGFAKGLRIAAVDWDDDGDCDMLCGTAEGRLRLLRDPEIGRPTSAKAYAGANSVLLTWDPNTQSRIRGYNVYRSIEATNGFENLTRPSIALPSYRDLPAEIRDYWYRITSVSRFYTAGNSTPQIQESAPSEALAASLGGVTLSLPKAECFLGETVDVILSINNSLDLGANGLYLSLAYDAKAFRPVEVIPSGLTDRLSFTQQTGGGRWTIRANGGEIAAGSGTLFTLRFEAIGEEEGAAELTLDEAALRTTTGQTVKAPVPVSGSVMRLLRNPPQPANVSLLLDTIESEEATTFTLPVSLVTTKPLALDSLALDLAYDGARLSAGSVVVEGQPGLRPDAAQGRWTVSGLQGTLPAGTNALLAFSFETKAVDGDCRTEVSVTNLVARDLDGLAAVPALPASATVVIKDVVQKPEPGVDEKPGIPGWSDGEGDDGTVEWTPATLFLRLAPASVEAGEKFEIPVTITVLPSLSEPKAKVDASRLVLEVSYDEALVSPLSATAATPGVSFESTCAKSVWRIAGTAGTLRNGRNVPLTLRFRAVEQYGKHLAKIDFLRALAFSTSGKRMHCHKPLFPALVSIRFERPADDPSIVAPWSRGDVDGDGKLTRADRRELRELIDDFEEEEEDDEEEEENDFRKALRAGDYNGDGRLTNADYLLQRKHFKKTGVLK